MSIEYFVGDPTRGLSNLSKQEPRSLEQRVAALETAVAKPHERLEALEKKIHDLQNRVNQLVGKPNKPSPSRNRETEG